MYLVVFFHQQEFFMQHKNKLGLSLALCLGLSAFIVSPALAAVPAFPTSFMGYDEVISDINASPVALSTDGSTIIGRILATNPFEAFRWTLQNGLENLGALGSGNTLASLLSADGSVVSGYSINSDGWEEAYVWTEADGMVGLGTLGGTEESKQSRPSLMTADGTVVTGVSINTGGHTGTFRWTAGDGMIGLGTLGGFGDDDYSYPTVMSTDGSVIAGYGLNTDGHDEAFRWTAGDGMVGLGTLGGFEGDDHSFAQFMSTDGSVIAGYAMNTDGHDEAYRWTGADGMVGLGTLGGFEGDDNSYPQFMSTDGSVIAGHSLNTDGNNEAFRWTAEDGMAALGFLEGDTESSVQAMSTDGSRIFGASDAGEFPHAYLWTAEDGMKSMIDVLTGLGVNMEGWKLFQARRVNTYGMVVWLTGTLNDTSMNVLAKLGENPGLITEDELKIALVPTLTPAQQVHDALDTGIDQSLFVAGQALSSFTPPPLQAAADTGMSAGARPAKKPFSGYAVGSFGMGQNNDWNNNDTNGATGFLFHANDDLSFGGGIIGSYNLVQTHLGGQSHTTASGLSAIGAYQSPDSLFLEGTLVAAYLDVDTNRHYMNGSDIDGSHGETHGFGYGGSVRGGISLVMDNKISLMPYLGLEASHTHLDGYTEQGGAFPASIASQNSNRVASSIGLEARQNLSPNLEIGGRGAWGHRLSNNGGSLTATTASITSVLPGAAGNRNWAEGAVTTAYKISNSSKFTGEISGRLGNTEQTAARVTLGLFFGF
jgi:probable HAF family extracellular repeat protein